MLQARQSDGYWRTVAHDLVSQNYEVFYLLAGVRGCYGPEARPIIEPRGLPPAFEHDIQIKHCDSIKLECVYHLYKLDGKNHTVFLGEHTWSYLTLAELEAESRKPITEQSNYEQNGFKVVQRKRSRARPKVPVVRRHPLSWLVHDIQRLQPGVDSTDLRLVFGFDNV